MSFSIENHTLILDEERIDAVLSPAAEFFVNSPKHAITEIPMFSGAGVYAIYLLDARNTMYENVITADYPIYIGKAVLLNCTQN